MLLFGGVLALAALALWVFGIADVVTTPAGQVRNLPKPAWLVVVVVVVDLGAIAWLVAGRRRLPPTAQRGRGPRAAGPPRRRAARPVRPDDDDEFLAGLALRTEEEKRRRRRRHDEGPDDPG